jgi:hypothetical protein
LLGWKHYIGEILGVILPLGFNQEGSGQEMLLISSYAL